MSPQVLALLSRREAVRAVALEDLRELLPVEGPPSYFAVGTTAQRQKGGAAQSWHWSESNSSAPSTPGINGLGNNIRSR